MPKVGFYAVRVGKEIGVYNSWEECKNQTQGYANARYKRFNTLKEAEGFAYGTMSSTPLPRQESNSGTRSLSRAKGKKRAHMEIEDESCWDVVYSDGACKGNGKVGSVAGVGVWWGHEDPRNIAERCPGSQTNNKAELIAILRVLETTPLSKRSLLIKTDSQYSIDCFSKWISNWTVNNWKTSTGKDVKNEGIIRCIHSHLGIRSKSGQKVCFQHVEGHSGEVGNEGADYLANEGTRKPAVQERDWEELEGRLVKELHVTASNALVEDPQGPVDTAEPIPLELHSKSRKLGEAGVPSHWHDQLDGPSTSTPNLKANSFAISLAEKTVVQASRTPTPILYHDVPAKFRNGVAEQKQSRTRLDKLSSSSSKDKPLSLSATPTEPRKADETEVQASSIRIPSDIPLNARLVGNAKKPVEPVSESREMESTGLVPSSPMRLCRVFGNASLRAHCATAQSLEGPSRPPQGFHADSSTQSPVKVLYVAPPLVPVRVEDVNFEDYTDCLVDDADLALSD